jgi:hypothetical protein
MEWDKKIPLGRLGRQMREGPEFEFSYCFPLICRRIRIMARHRGGDQQFIIFGHFCLDVRTKKTYKEP